MAAGSVRAYIHKGGCVGDVLRLGLPGSLPEESSSSLWSLGATGALFSRSLSAPLVAWFSLQVLFWTSALLRPCCWTSALLGRR